MLSRKGEKQFVGNNLEKPHILLKRIKVRDTVQRDEEMKREENFTQRAGGNVVDLLDEDFANFNYSSGNTNTNTNNRQSTSTQPDISSHNNFLQYPGLTLPNLKPTP